MEILPNTPLQEPENTYDCGVCTCINSEILARTGQVKALSYGSSNDKLAKMRSYIKEELANWRIIESHHFIVEESVSSD